MKTDLKEKFYSRKLWAAVVAFVVSVLAAVFKEDIPQEAAELMQNGVIALCVYIFGEAGVDIARLIGQHNGTAADTNTTTETTQTYTETTGNNMGQQSEMNATSAEPHPRESETNGGTDEPDGQEDEEPPG